MARYGEALRNRVVARLLPPESANAGMVAKEIGVSVQTVERWREEVHSRPARGRAWNANARLDAVIHCGGDGRSRQERVVPRARRIPG